MPEPSFSKEQCSQVIQTIGLGPHAIKSEIVSQTQQSGFSGSIIIRVTTNSGFFCIRGWPPNALPAPRIKGLHRLLEHLAAVGVQTVAVPLSLPVLHLKSVSDPVEQQFPNAATLLSFGKRYWQLEPWLTGEANFNQKPNAEKLTSTMHELAKWHIAAARFQPTNKERMWFESKANETSPAVTERKAILAEWSLQKIAKLKRVIQFENQISLQWKELARLWLDQFETVSLQIDNELNEAHNWPVALQPCLRDVWHDHILFTANQVTGIIDPSATRTECVAADLSRLLGSLDLEGPHSWNVALNEYQTIRPLTVNEKNLIPVLYRSGVLLSGLSWLDRVCLKKEYIPQGKRVLIRVRQLYSRLRII